MSEDTLTLRARRSGAREVLSTAIEASFAARAQRRCAGRVAPTRPASVDLLYSIELLIVNEDRAVALPVPPAWPAAPNGFPAAVDDAAARSWSSIRAREAHYADPKGAACRRAGGHAGRCFALRLMLGCARPATLLSLIHI